jgi:hypothetical protein
MHNIPHEFEGQQAGRSATCYGEGIQLRRKDGPLQWYWEKFHRGDVTRWKEFLWGLFSLLALPFYSADVRPTNSHNTILRDITPLSIYLSEEETDTASLIDTTVVLWNLGGNTTSSKIPQETCYESCYPTKPFYFSTRATKTLHYTQGDSTTAQEIS